MSSDPNIPHIAPPPPRGGTAVNEQGGFLRPWTDWFSSVHRVLSQMPPNATATSQTAQESLVQGMDATIALPALTTGAGPHAAGSMTLKNGILVAYTAPT